MTDSTTVPAFIPKTSEKTFSAYSKSQGQSYAQARPDYHPALYKAIIDYHHTTGGQNQVLLDVGTGPGTAVRALAPSFINAIGLDPSDGMIEHARTLSGVSSSGPLIRFEVSTAEDLGWHLDPPITESSVDLLIAGTAAHWFDMPRFWTRAAQVLKEGGTVAIWTVGGSKVHPETPNAVAIQAFLDEVEEEQLSPYFEPGNLLTRDLYRELQLPWTVVPAVSEFEEKSFQRKEWGPDTSNDFESPGLPIDMELFEKILGTSSPIQRWREAHPDDEGTETDVVRVMRRGVERMLQDVGVEEGKEVVVASLRGALLMIKKKN